MTLEQNLRHSAEKKGLSGEEEEHYVGGAIENMRKRGKLPKTGFTRGRKPKSKEPEKKPEPESWSVYMTGERDLSFTYKDFSSEKAANKYIAQLKKDTPSQGYSIHMTHRKDGISHFSTWNLDTKNRRWKVGK